VGHFCPPGSGTGSSRTKSMCILIHLCTDPAFSGPYYQSKFLHNFEPTKTDTVMFVLISTTAKSFLFYVRYSALFHLPSLWFHCFGGCWNRTAKSEAPLCIHVHCSDLWIVLVEPLDGNAVDLGEITAACLEWIDNTLNVSFLWIRTRGTVNYRSLPWPWDKSSRIFMDYICETWSTLVLQFIYQYGENE
jgi:hypothetical protein